MFTLMAYDKIGIEQATVAIRIFEQESLAGMVYSGRLWEMEHPPATEILPYDFNVVGKIGVMGGLFVMPEYRRDGIGPQLAREARREAFRRGCDYVAGYMLKSLHDAGMWRKYGHQMACPVMEDFVFEGRHLGPLYVTLGGENK